MDIILRSARLNLVFSRFRVLEQLSQKGGQDSVVKQEHEL